MWKRPISIIMILRMENSSVSCSFATKYFLFASVSIIKTGGGGGYSKGTSPIEVEE